MDNRPVTSRYSFAYERKTVIDSLEKTQQHGCDQLLRTKIDVTEDIFVIDK